MRVLMLGLDAAGKTSMLKSLHYYKGCAENKKHIHS